MGSVKQIATLAADLGLHFSELRNEETRAFVGGLIAAFKPGQKFYRVAVWNASIAPAGGWQNIIESRQQNIAAAALGARLKSERKLEQVQYLGMSQDSRPMWNTRVIQMFQNIGGQIVRIK